MRIQPSLLAEGKFPIISIDALGVGIKGTLFGGQIDAQLIGGILKLDSNFQIIGVTDSTTPVFKRVFYLGIQGGFSMLGMGGFTIRLGLSELGPLQVFVNVKTPTGVMLVPQIGLVLNDFSAGVEFFKTLPSIEDPFALRNPEFGLATDMTADQWLASLQQQVALQAKSIANNPSQNGFFAAFTAPMVITGSARVYSLYTSQAVFNGQVIVKISTDGKFLIVGKLNFADNNVSISGRLYADLSRVASGDVVVLFLADIPDQVRLLTIHGKLKMGFRNPSGEDVEFDVLDETSSGTPTSTKPTATIIDPIGADGSIDVSRIVGQNYVDVAFQAPGGALLDYASILDSTGVGASELTLTRGTTSLGTLGPKPTPITTLTTGIGVALVPLVYDAATESVYRFAAERTVVTGTLTACKANANNWDCREETQDLGSGPVTVVTAHTAKVTVVTKTADLPGGAADLEIALLDLAIRKTGTNRFRYQFTATPAWVPGTVTVDFAANSFKNADVTGEDGNPIVGTANDAISLEFHVEGATANVIDPGAGGSVDVNALNDRNWLDVLFQAPTGFEIDSASVLDAGAEFTLTGPGLGTITVDSSRAPIQLSLTGLGAGQKVFRYWLVGKYAATGAVTLTYLADSWSVAQTTPPAVTPIVLGEITITVAFPNTSAGFVLDVDTIIDGGDAEVEITSIVDPTTGSAPVGWTFTLASMVNPVAVSVGPGLYRFKLTITFATGAASVGVVRYRLVSGTWNEKPADGSPGSVPVTFTSTAAPVGEETVAAVISGSTTVVVTLPSGGTSGIDATLSIDPASVLDGAADFADSDGNSTNGIQFQSSDALWTVTLDQTRTIARIGSTNRYLVPVLLVIATGAPLTATITPLLLAGGVAYTGALANNAQSSSRPLTAAELSNAGTFVDVAFAASVGHQLDPTTVGDTNNFAFGGFGGTGVAFSSGPQGLNLGNGVFRFMVSTDFRPGEVEVIFNANSWDENPARGPPAGDHRLQPRLHAAVQRRRGDGGPGPHDPGRRCHAGERGRARRLNGRLHDDQRGGLPRGRLPQQQRLPRRPHDDRRRRARAPRRSGHAPHARQPAPRRHERHVPVLVHGLAGRRPVRGHLPRRLLLGHRREHEPGRARELHRPDAVRRAHRARARPGRRPRGVPGRDDRRHHDRRRVHAHLRRVGRHHDSRLERPHAERRRAAEPDVRQRHAADARPRSATASRARRSRPARSPSRSTRTAGATPPATRAARLSGSSR